MASIMYTNQPLSELQGDLATIKGLNIDVILNVNDAVVGQLGDTLPTLQSHIDYLNALQSAGLKAIIHVCRLTQRYAYEGQSIDYTDLDTYLNGLKSHPALYGWYIDDEPTTADLTLAQRQAIYSHIKSIDPNHAVVEVYPGYGSAWWPSGTTASPYSDTTHDLFGIDNYPGHGGSLSTFNSQIAASYTNLTATDKTRAFGTVQVYGSSSSNIPNASEIASYAGGYQSAGWNSKGIAFWMWKWSNSIYYSAPAGWTFLKDNPSLWSSVASVAATYHEDLYATGPSAQNQLLNVDGSAAGPILNVDGSATGPLLNVN